MFNKMSVVFLVLLAFTLFWGEKLFTEINKKMENIATKESMDSQKELLLASPRGRDFL